MGDQRTANFSQKGFTKNFLELMKLREQFSKCCEEWLTQVATANSTSIIFSGSGTAESPLTASVLISQASGNTLVINPDGLFSAVVTLPVTGANDGLSVSATIVKLGQTVGQAGAPASLTEAREIPFNGFNINLTGSGVLNIATTSAPVESGTVLNVNGIAEITSISAGVGISTAWTNYSFLNTQNARAIHGLGSGQFGDLIEDLTSVYLAANNWGGYVGMYATAYVYGPTPFNPGAGPNAGYVGGFSAIPVYDNAGATALPNLFGFHSALNNNNGPVTAAKDFWVRELNSVNRVGNAPTVTNHYGIYMEAFTKATNNYAIWINGAQLSYMGTGGVGIGSGITTPTALLQLGAGTAAKAPLIITSGVNLTTPISGAIENNGTNLFYTSSGAVRETVVASIAVTASTTNTNTNKIQINIGGTTYYLLASTSPT